MTGTVGWGSIFTSVIQKAISKEINDIRGEPELHKRASHVKIQRQNSLGRKTANAAACWWRSLNVSIRLMWPEPRDHRKRVLAESQRQARPADHLGPGSPCQNKRLPHCSLLSRSLTEREQMASCVWKHQTGNVSMYHMLLPKPMNTMIYTRKDERFFLVDLFNAHLYPLNSNLLMNIKV